MVIREVLDRHPGERQRAEDLAPFLVSHPLTQLMVAERGGLAWARQVAKWFPQKWTRLLSGALADRPHQQDFMLSMTEGLARERVKPGGPWWMWLPGSTEITILQQGEAPNGAVADAVEAAGMRAALQWAAATWPGAHLAPDDHRTRSWDIGVYLGSPPIDDAAEPDHCVEAKGTAQRFTELSSVWVTKNQVEMSTAGQPSTWHLVAALDLDIARDENGTLTARGGHTVVESPWHPSASRLTALKYRYELEES